MASSSSSFSAFLHLPYPLAPTTSVAARFYPTAGAASAVAFDKDNQRRLAMSLSATSMNMGDFKANINAGCKWVVCAGYVYDVGVFIKNHPGGAFLLERCIGADVSQFFMGREAFDNTVAPHPHSERAYRLLRTMCVAAIRSETNVTSWADAPTMPDDACTDSWQLMRRTVLPGDARRPIVKLEFVHESATATPAISWKPSSFGRCVLSLM